MEKKEKKAKKVKGWLIGLGAFFALFIAFVIWAWNLPDPEPEVQGETLDIDIPIKAVDEVKAGDDGKSAVYTSDDLEIEITEAWPEEMKESLENVNLGELVQGVTKQGDTFKGRGDTVYVTSGTTTYKATVTNNPKKKDVSKAAGVVSALSKTMGYSADNDNWNHDYAIYYIEAAQCLLYYPKQLRLSKEDENSDLTFKDSRSGAVIQVSLTENPYSCMDEIEETIVSDSSTQVLASGTDWYTVETYSESGGTKYTMFSRMSFGNVYEVDVHFTYEDQYDFVFDELRDLIKCKFIGSGVWVSNAKANTKGKKVEAIALSDEEEYWPDLDETAFYFEDMDCMLYYPDIFTKAYQDDNGVEYFTDPKTGAFIMVEADSVGMTSAELQSYIMDTVAMTESELVGEYACRGRRLDENGYGYMMYGISRDDKVYLATLIYPAEYNYSYEGIYDMLRLILPGDEISSTEMQNLVFEDYSTYITIPLQFKEYEDDDPVHCFKDAFSGLELRLSFTELTDDDDCENLYEMFNVVAEDEDIIYGEYYIKWHNSTGAYIGAVSKHYACLIEIPYPNAYSVYSLCWDRFRIDFSDEEEREEESDKIISASTPSATTTPTSAAEPTATLTPTSASAPTTVPETTDGAVNDQPTKVAEEFTMTAKVKSEYEMLMNRDYSIYPDLPFYELPGIIEEEVICGELNHVSYEMSASEYNFLLDYIDQMYDRGFKKEYYSADTEYGYDSWILTGTRDDTGFPDMYMLIDSHHDSSGTEVDITYLYISETMDYKKGVINLDYSKFGGHHSDDFFLETFADFGVEIEDYTYYLGDMIDLCCRFSIRTVITEGFEVIYDNEELVLEVGSIVNGQFVVDKVYYDNPALGLYEVIDSAGNLREIQLDY